MFHIFAQKGCDVIVRGVCSAPEIHIHENEQTTPSMAGVCEDMACVLVKDEFYLWR